MGKLFLNQSMTWSWKKELIVFFFFHKNSTWIWKILSFFFTVNNYNETSQIKLENTHDSKGILLITIHLNEYCNEEITSKQSVLDRSLLKFTTKKMEIKTQNICNMMGGPKTKIQIISENFLSWIHYNLILFLKQNHNLVRVEFESHGLYPIPKVALADLFSLFHGCVYIFMLRLLYIIVKSKRKNSS